MRSAVVLVALGVTACGAADPGLRIAELPELTARTCDGLATEYAQTLEARIDSALAAVADVPSEEATNAVVAEMRAVDNAVAIRLRAMDQRQDLVCDEEKFKSGTEAAFWQQFRDTAPPALSSVDVGHTWEDFWAVLDDSISEALDPTFLNSSPA